MEGLTDVDGIAEEVRLLGEEQVQEDLDASEHFAETDLEMGARGTRIEADGVYAFPAGQENGPLVVETLSDNQQLPLPENLLGPDHGIQCPEPRIVQENHL